MSVITLDHYENGAKIMRPVLNREEYLALRSSNKQLAMLKAVRSGDEAKKRRLVQMNYSCLPGDDGVLKGCTRMSTTVGMDIDHVPPEQMQPLCERILAKKDELGLQMLEKSAREAGYHLVFRRRPELSQQQNLEWASGVLEVPYDAGAKDITRVFYSTSAEPEDLIYLDDGIFEREEVFEGERVKDLGTNSWTSQAAKPSVTNLHELDNSVEDSADDKKIIRDNSRDSCQKEFPTEYHGIPFTEILKKYWEVNNGGFEPTEGDRDTLTFQLACDLRHICGRNADWLDQVIPCYDGFTEEEKRQKIANALASKYEGMPQRLKSVLDVLGTDSRGFNNKDTALSADKNSVSLKESRVNPCQNIDSQLWEWGAQIEGMMEDFPLLKDICKGLKKNQYPAAMFVGGGLLMTLMTRCTYRFYHRPEELRRLNNSTLIIGDPASGKSFATRLFKLLASPIVAADKVGKDAINAYREQMRTKGANKEKPKKPKVIVRIHPARTSNAQFIQDMVNSVEEVDGQPMQLHMLTFDTELDNTVSVQKGGSWIDKFSMELKAFHNEEDGQAYSNNDSILQDFIVTWNFIYTGTPIALKKKVNEQNFGSGLATRLTCIPLPATNFQMMSRESTLDYDSDNRLKEWALKLDKTKGELSLQKIVDELYDWTARRMMDAADNDSRADEMLLKRCAYHGVNFAAPFIVMRHWAELHQDGDYWCGQFETDEVDWRLAELIVNIQYACQRHYFGAMAEAYFDNKLREACVNVKRQSKTYEGFERLPDEFTSDDVMRCFNLNTTSAARMRISRMMRDRLIEKTGDINDDGKNKSFYRKTGVMML